MQLSDVAARTMNGEFVAEAFETKVQPELACLFQRAADLDSSFGRLQNPQLLKCTALDGGLHLHYRAMFENNTAGVYPGHCAIALLRGHACANLFLHPSFHEILGWTRALGAGRQALP
jgi:hypothetical protein